MMLRRLKEDVEKNLAPKQETIIEVRWNKILMRDLFFSPKKRRKKTPRISIDDCHNITGELKERKNITCNCFLSG